jgi:hypothetical protein
MYVDQIFVVKNVFDQKTRNLFDVILGRHRRRGFKVRVLCQGSPEAAAEVQDHGKAHTGS